MAPVALWRAHVARKLLARMLLHGMKLTGSTGRLSLLFTNDALQIERERGSCHLFQAAFVFHHLREVGAKVSRT